MGDGTPVSLAAPSHTVPTPLPPFSATKLFCFILKFLISLPPICFIIINTHLQYTSAQAHPAVK